MQNSELTVLLELENFCAIFLASTVYEETAIIWIVFPL